MSRNERLAEAILKDRAARTEPARSKSVLCFCCGRSFTYRGHSGDDNGCFCSVRCREGYDAGYPAFDPDYASKNNPRWYSLPIAPHGFYIDCAGCGRRFESLGLRCCSSECTRMAQGRVETRALIAEAGISIDKRRPCQKCGKPIPRWRNGRAVRKDAKTCGRC